TVERVDEGAGHGDEAVVAAVAGVARGQRQNEKRRQDAGEDSSHGYAREGVEGGRLLFKTRFLRPWAQAPSPVAARLTNPRPLSGILSLPKDLSKGSKGRTEPGAGRGAFRSFTSPAPFTSP